MANKSSVPATLSFGTPSLPVNATLTAPDSQGLINAAPPRFGDGPVPQVAVNGVELPPLGFGGNQPLPIHKGK